MRYTIIPVTPFEQNCTVFWCEKTRQAAVIDPGGDIERVLDFLDQEKLTLAKILVTHGHIDHAGGVGAQAAATSIILKLRATNRADRTNWVMKTSSYFYVCLEVPWEPA